MRSSFTAFWGSGDLLVPCFAFANGKFATDRPDLFVFGSIISATRLAASTYEKYSASVRRLFRYAKTNHSLDALHIKIPFSEELLWFFFSLHRIINTISKKIIWSWSGCERNHKKGVLVSTMKGDLSAFRYYCKMYRKPIPIQDYMVLDILFQSFKPWQSNRPKKAKTKIIFDNLCAFVKQFNTQISSYTNKVYKFTFLLAWFGLLRTGEWTQYKYNDIDPEECYKI